jgi:hypothetical protein
MTNTTQTMTIVRSSSGKILLEATNSDRYRRTLDSFMASTPAESRADGYRFDTPAGTRCMDSADIVRIVSNTSEQHAEAAVIAARVVVFKGWRVPRIDGADEDIVSTALGLLTRLGWPNNDILVPERHRAVRDWLHQHAPLDFLTEDKLTTAIRMIKAVLPYPTSTEDQRQADRLLRIFAGSDEEAERLRVQEAKWLIGGRQAGAS